MRRASCGLPTGQILSGTKRRLILTFNAPTESSREFSLGSLRLRYQIGAEPAEVRFGSEQFMLAVVPGDQRQEALASVNEPLLKESWLSNNLGRLKAAYRDAIAAGDRKKAQASIDGYYGEARKAESELGIAIVDEETKSDLATMEGDLNDAFAGPAAEQEVKQNRLAKKAHAQGACGTARQIVTLAEKEKPMALIPRIARLFRADMHSILDSIEEPQSLLKQAVREMAAAIESGEQKIEVLARREERLGVCLAEQDRSLTETEQRIDLCFRSNDENLARAMIRRKLEIEKRIKLTARERAALVLERERHARALSVQRAKLASVKAEMEILAKEDRHPPSTSESTYEHDYTVSEEEIEVAFLAERERRASARSTNG